MGSPVTFPVTLDRQDGSTVIEGEMTATNGLPGGLPAWFQSGDGDPVTANPTVPNTVGGLYFDTSGNSGLWVAAGPASANWLPLGGTNTSSNSGLVFEHEGAGDVAVVLEALGAEQTVFIASGGGGYVQVTDTGVIVGLPDETTFEVLLGGKLAIPAEPTASQPVYARAPCTMTRPWAS